MRDIRFRAWHRTDVKEMLRQIPENQVMLKVIEIDFDRQEVYVERDSGSHYSLGFDLVELMQYTGLKDKNGKEIYERDILRTDVMDMNVLASKQEEWIVEWWNGASSYMCTGKDIFRRLEDIKECEVIGNIWENPELLKI